MTLKTACNVIAMRPRPSELSSTEDLMSEVAEGDMVAFGVVYDRLAPGVFGTALKVLQGPGQAEEVAQAVLLEVWVNAARFDPTRGAACGWVTMITRRWLRDALIRLGGCELLPPPLRCEPPQVKVADA